MMGGHFVMSDFVLFSSTLERKILTTLVAYIVHVFVHIHVLIQRGMCRKCFVAVRAEHNIMGIFVMLI